MVGPSSAEQKHHQKRKEPTLVPVASTYLFQKGGSLQFVLQFCPPKISDKGPTVFELHFPIITSNSEHHPFFHPLPVCPSRHSKDGSRRCKKVSTRSPRPAQFSPAQPDTRFLFPFLNFPPGRNKQTNTGSPPPPLAARRSGPRTPTTRRGRATPTPSGRRSCGPRAGRRASTWAPRTPRTRSTTAPPTRRTSGRS